ncbi:Git3 domain-containing protein [Mycena kentingensis (nom. inval.)]|nr:Git3 domain-containing protein [Mycena kentingensis (nom. inval.)]
MSTLTAPLPDGSEWLLAQTYSNREVQGVTVLVVISCISLFFVVSLLSAIALSAFNTRSSLDQHLFVRTHVAAYFVSLLLGDIFQAIGSILNARWVHERAVEFGPLCTAQGVLKQLADVSTAVWTTVIAVHTFCLLFLELKSSRFTLFATLIAGWFGIAAVVIAGPAALDTAHHGPFYGISGYWCWIGPRWIGSRVGLDYLFMFMAAFVSFILYTLIFLRFRGNIIVTGRRVTFRLRKAAPWRGKQFESQALTIARQMLLYPVAYTVLILPIAASRFSDFAGEEVPFGVTVFSAAIFLLSGIVNVTLFTMTRRILPPESFRIPKWKISQPRPIPELSVNSDYGESSYYQSSGSYSPSIEDKEKSLGLDVSRTSTCSAATTAGACALQLGSYGCRKATAIHRSNAAASPGGCPPPPPTRHPRRELL